MRKLLKSFLRKLFYQKYYNWWDGLRGYFLENKDIKLTKEEKKQIDTFYSKFTNLNLGYTLYKVFKSFDKFDIKYIPDTLYYSYILRHLNPMSVSETFANKGIYGYYFKEVNRPKELVRKINGNYIDYNNDIVTEDAAIEKILSYDWGGVVAKPSIDSGCGKGIKFITNYNREVLHTLFTEYGDNFVIQGIVQQSAKTKQFNPTSLNTFRITTLLIQGKFSILSRVFKSGSKGSKVDNMGCVGEGGTWCGVDDSGNLSKFGVTKKGHKVDKSSSGVLFKEYNFAQEIEDIDYFCKTLHEKLPFCCIVGWDVALDENNKPLLVEVNLKEPSILYEQLCTGPIFGERTDEVIDYVTRNGAINMWIKHFRKS